MQKNGMLIEDVNPLLQLAVVYPFAVYGSVLPDFDHNWNSCPSKDIVSFAINKLLHLTNGVAEKNGKQPFILSILNAKHRSWQTHSVLFLLLMCAVSVVLSNSLVGTFDAMLFKLVSEGLILGIISHLVLDALTPEGIWLAIPSFLSGKKLKFRVVPKKQFFATGGRWETLVRYMMWVIIVILLCRIIYLASPYRIEFNFPRG